jgi:peptidoglycan/LPS O-acetylase OafA/YrhL
VSIVEDKTHAPDKNLDARDLTVREKHAHTEHAHTHGDMFLSLEGLRGVLAIAVMFGHFNVIDVLARFGLAFNFQLAVDLFFMLSGCVLTHSNYVATNKVDARSFTIKRFARLYPLHLITLVLAAALFAHQGKAFDAWGIARNVFLLHGDNYEHPMYNGPSWSIAVEFWCSIGFLFVVRRATSARVVERRLWLAASAILVGISAALLHWVVFDDPTGTFWPGWGNYLRGVAGFCVGILAYHLLPVLRRLSGRALQLIGWAAAVGIAIFFFTRWTPWMGIFVYIFGFGLIASLIANPTMFPILASRLCVWLGAISYSVYLLHGVVYAYIIQFAGPEFVKGFSGKLVLLPTVLTLAWVTYTALERPAQRLLRRALL